jgi:hypothetical protein
VTERDDDIRMLDEIIAKAVELDEADEEHTIPTGAFMDIRAWRLRQGGPGLSDKQRVWVRGVYEKLFDTPLYENLVSSGKVSLEGYGKTPTPEVLRKLPLKPPGGRA